MRYSVWVPYAFTLFLIIVFGIRTHKASAAGSDSKMQPLTYGGMITAILAVLVVFTVVLPYAYMGRLIAFIPILMIAAVYYALLHAFLPYLRKHISAVGCSYLWLIPSTLPFTQYAVLVGNKPLFWVDLGPAASRMLRIVLIVYLAAAAVSFIYKIAAHLKYRKEILAPARALAGSSAYSILEEEAEKIGRFKDYTPDLYVSPAVSAPVSIGFFKKSRAILLPSEEYSEDDLRIIFRHELIHIARNDCEAKLDMALVTSLLWPVPLIRRTSESCAEDLELSCDELVLRGCSEAQRRAYAQLILTESAENRGFSSCLSAGAESLKYRLRHVMDPSKKRSGALLVCIVLLIVMLLFRSAGLSVYAGSGRDLVFGRTPLGTSAEWGMVFMEENGSSRFASAVDKEKLNEYIAGLQLSYASWDDPKDPLQDELYLEHSINGSEIHLRIIGDRILVSGPGIGSAGYYRVPGGIDWEYLRSVLSF